MPTREEIIDATERAIREVGINQVTTRRIAADAGCSEGSIYNHFVDKNDLIACTVSQRIARFPDYATSLPERAGQRTVAQNLHDLAVHATGFFATILPHVAGMLADPGQMAVHARDIDRAGRGPRWVLRATVEYLDLEQHGGRVHAAANTRGAAAALLGGCLQHAMTVHGWGADVAEVSDDQHVTDLVEAVLVGLVPVPGLATPSDPQER